MTTTQKAPSIIECIGDMEVKSFRVPSETVGFHGYCTIAYSNRTHRLLPLFDVYCQIEGDEVRIGRDLKERAACTLINDANAKSHNGKEV